MSNPFENPPTLSPEEKLEEAVKKAEEQEPKEAEEIKEEKVPEAEPPKEREEESMEKIEAVLDIQEKTVEIEEKISMRSLPEKEVSLFDRAKEKLKENLRQAVLFGIMTTSLLGAGCKEKKVERPVPERPAAVQVEKGEKKIIIERNGRKIVTTERAQRMLAEGDLRALQEIGKLAKSTYYEMEKIDELGGEGYVKYKIAVIDRHIETMEEGNENGAWNKEVSESKKEKAELERILKNGKSEEFAQQQRKGFEKFLQSAEKEFQQKEKIISRVKEIRDKEEKEYKEKGYDNSVVVSPDFSDLDPTLRKK